jgi:hypothetical protein
MYTCKKCGREHPDRSSLGKCYYKHRMEEQADNQPEVKPETEEEKPGEILIPMDRVEEFKYLSKGNFVRVICDGVMAAEGMVVQNVKYYR